TGARLAALDQHLSGAERELRAHRGQLVQIVFVHDREYRTRGRLRRPVQECMRWARTRASRSSSARREDLSLPAAVSSSETSFRPAERATASLSKGTVPPAPSSTLA